MAFGIMHTIKVKAGNTMGLQMENNRTEKDCERTFAGSRVEWARTNENLHWVHSGNWDKSVYELCQKYDIPRIKKDSVAVSDDETVSVADISNALFGTWSGKFNYNVEYNGEAGGSGPVTPTPDPDDGGAVEPGEGQQSFTIDGVTYLADEGMTWGEWIASEYNTDGYTFVSAKLEGYPMYNYSLMVNADKDMFAAAPSGEGVSHPATDKVIGVWPVRPLQLYSVEDNGYTLVKPEANLITFTIDGTEYQAEEGMTFAQWIDSEYNTYGYIVEGGLVKKSPSGPSLQKMLNPGYYRVLAADNIDTYLEEKLCWQ